VLLMVMSMIVAQAPCDPAWPTITLRIGGAGLLPSLEAAIRDEAEYEARQSGFCPIADRREARATAQIDWPETGALSLAVTVPSGAAVRQLQRGLELSAVPPDGYALTIAASLGELLREARRELPGLASPEPELAPTWGVGVQLGGEAFSGGLVQGALDAFVRRRFGRVTLGLEGGVHPGLSVEAASGRVVTLVASGAAHIGFDLLLVGRVALAALAGVRVGWLRVEGVARAPATGASATGVLATARGGAELRWSSRPVLLFVRVTAGAPLASVAALDGSTTVTATTGVEGAAVLGVGGAF
jgi:hypothetical protein